MARQDYPFVWIPGPSDRTRSSATLGAWFLGPKGENRSLLQDLADIAIDAHVNDRAGLLEEPVEGQPAEQRPVHANDPVWIDESITGSRAYQEATEFLKQELRTLSRALKQSVPFYSYRYQSHMLWDVTLPAVAGYLAGMLHNQNNVAAEASPVTTLLEMQVGDDLCKMLGYKSARRRPLPTEPDSVGFTIEEIDDERFGAWGHITSGGTVANIESMWAARNLKYYPVALAAALRDDGSPIAHARGLRVNLPDGHSAVLSELDPWRLLNLLPQDVLALPRELRRCYSVSSDALTQALDEHSLQRLGAFEFQRRYLGGVEPAAVIGSAAMHYSWQKGASLLGVGAHNVINVPVDLDCRMSLAELRRALDRCLAERRPVLQVVVVLGTTEHSAVDPLDDVLELRRTYRRAGLDFLVHVDAAWGGYFASMLRKPSKESCADEARSSWPETETDWFKLDDVEGRHRRVYSPARVMSAYVERQYRALRHADSITVDPHKAGFIPYPAGALCYRDVRMREVISLRAPVVFHGDADPSVGFYGIEGSKPGAAVCAVYLSHRVIGLDATGYGMILGKTMFNATRFYSEIATMDGSFNRGYDYRCDEHRIGGDAGHDPETPGHTSGRAANLALREHSQESHEHGRRARGYDDWDDDFDYGPPGCADDLIVVPLHRLPAERRGLRPSQIEDQRKVIARLCGLENDDLIDELRHKPDVARLFRELGPDQNIIAYAFNFFVRRGEYWMPNQNVRRLNMLNEEVFQALSALPPENPDFIPLIVTASELDPRTAGESIVSDFLRRLRVKAPQGDPLTTPVKFLISTVANPWLTDTARPKPTTEARPGQPRAPGPSFIPDIIEILRKTAVKQASAIRTDMRQER